MRASGRVTLFPPLVVALIFGLLFLHGLPRQAVASERTWIDPCDLCWEGGPEWADPRWAEEFEALLCTLDPLATDDLAALRLWKASIETLSFVQAVRRFEVGAAGGVELELELRRPIACIPAGDSFLTVAADGTILHGAWPVPPRVDDRWLPVIGPMSDAYALFDRALPGDYLAEEMHVVALDVAVSMSEHLGAAEQELLGRVVIDAAQHAQVSVTQPGIVLELEEGRVVLFGRAPYAEAPGELEPSHKWRSLARALQLVDPMHAEAALDWELVDGRWERPDLVPRAR